MKQRKARSLGMMIIAAVLLMIFMLTACQQPMAFRNNDQDNDFYETGELLLVLGDTMGGRTLYPDIDMNVTSYRISGNGPEGGAFDFSTTETMELVEDLTFGEWTITVEALNADDDVIGWGDTTVTVEIGEIATARITVEAFSGFGTLTLEISWPAADVFLPAVQASLLPVNGVERILDFTIDPAAGNGHFTTSDVAAGFYTLSVKLTDRGQLVMGAVEMVWLAEGAETAGTFDFTGVNDAFGSIDISIDPEMYEPFDVTINGAGATLAEDEIITLSTTIPSNVGDCFTFWYLNGQCLSTDEEWTFSGSDYGPGFYRLEVVMYTTDYTRGGSAVMIIEITD